MLLGFRGFRCISRKYVVVPGDMIGVYQLILLRRLTSSSPSKEESLANDHPFLFYRKLLCCTVAHRTSSSGASIDLVSKLLFRNREVCSQLTMEYTTTRRASTSRMHSPSSSQRHRSYQSSFFARLLSSMEDGRPNFDLVKD